MGYGRVLAAAAAILVSTAFVLLWWMRRTGLERKWFQYRAVAESIKTAAWRYMMEAPPFRATREGADRDAAFVSTVAGIEQDRLREESADAAEGVRCGVTESMRRIATLSLEERKARYLHDRLADQQNWYQKKSSANRRSAGLWTAFTLLAQVLAMALALFRIRYPAIPMSPVSFLMTGASSMVAWTQARRHDDLVEPYAVAAAELSQLATLAGTVTDRESLARFVAEVEEAISREHTKWRARRRLETGEARKAK
jgi:hypothetical protein